MEEQMSIKVDKSHPVKHIEVKKKVEKTVNKMNIKAMIKNLVRFHPGFVGFIVMALVFVPDYFLSLWIIEDVLKAPNSVSHAGIVLWMIICPLGIIASVGLVYCFGTMCKLLGEWVADIMENGW